MTSRLLYIAGGILIFLLLVWGFFNLSGSLPSFFGGNQATVKINDTTYKADLAESEEERQKGLSGKASLSDDKGMLFLFDNADYHSFWMKDMRFPIDILFISDDRIVTIYRDVPAPQNENETLPIYTPREPVDKVLELSAGQVEEKGIQEGDIVEIDL